jgi:hypothetical protein|tara:strand:+ start:765 stop:1259 length:495 start_codon:yes stop_codon:yes gene_type:complete
MSNLSSGKYAKFISDRSGLEFPYSEMVIEWNGSRVHISEFEKKHPQLEPKPHSADPQGLRNARPARTEPSVARILTLNPLSATNGSQTITVFEDNHGRTTGDTVRFRDSEPGAGLTSADINNSSGFTITVTNANNYTFTASGTATATEKIGGGSISAGPVTLTP